MVPSAVGPKTWGHPHTLQTTTPGFHRGLVGCRVVGLVTQTDAAWPCPVFVLGMYLFAGDAKPTESVVEVDPRTGRVTVVGHAPGDGTVLRSSAVMDERLGGDWSPRLQTPISWRGMQFLFTDHLGMTKDPAFSDNVLYLLLEQPR